ncbi:MAG: myo-inosose-2 dehydratase [Proteobacteria bacterium]|nr:myo-inosose-2 dehydratase [Pseudomonadota bacterium]
MKAKLGIAPIAWSNDDLPELGGETTLETCLTESKISGFSGVETGGKFPTTPEELGPILKKHKLNLASGWFSGRVLDSDLEEEKDRVLGQLVLFKELGAACMVYGETAGTIQNVRHAPLNTKRKLSDDDFKIYGKKLTLFAEFCSDFGMPISFHHHMGTAVETERELDLLMNHTGEAVHLLFDTGHMTFAGGNSINVINKYANRITHVHTKDIRSSIVDNLDKDKESFLDAVLKGAFTVPGDGNINFKEVVETLSKNNYEGWFIVEAEQDPAKANPLEMARIGNKELRECLSLNGYEIGEYRDE